MIRKRLLYQQPDAGTNGQATESANPELAGKAVANPTGSAWHNPSGDRGPSGEQNFGDWNQEVLRPFAPGDQFRGDAADVAVTVQEAPGGAPAPTIVQEQLPQEQQQQPPAQQTEPAQPAPAAAPDGEGTSATPGRDDSSPGDTAAMDVEGILRKYQSPEALASAYKELQRLSTAQGQAKKDLEQRLSQRLELFQDYFEEGEDGRPVLRPEAAAQRLQEVTPPPMGPDPNQVYQQVVAEKRNEYRSLSDDPEFIEAALERAKSQIQAETQRRVQVATEQAKAHEFQQRQRAYQRTAQVFSGNPELEEVKAEVDTYLRRFPAAVRHTVVNNGWLDLGRIARLERTSKQLPSIVQEAYEAGVKAGTRGQQPDAQTPVQAGSRAPKPGAAQPDPDRAIKDGILGAGSNQFLDMLRTPQGGLPSLFE